MFYSFHGKCPRVDPTAFVSTSAELIGDVTVGPRLFGIQRLHLVHDFVHKFFRLSHRQTAYRKTAFGIRNCFFQRLQSQLFEHSLAAFVVIVLIDCLYQDRLMQQWLQ